MEAAMHFCLLPGICYEKMDMMQPQHFNLELQVAIFIWESFFCNSRLQILQYTQCFAPIP